MNKILLTLALGIFFLHAGFAADTPIRPGDHVAIVGNTFADQLRVHGYLETLLLLRTQENPVSIRNLGWGGDMVSARDRPTNFPTEESTLTDHKTDVIIACFGMGESFAGESGLGDFRQDLEAFIASHRGKKYNGESEVRLILVSPIAYENLGELTPNWEQRNRDLGAYTQVIVQAAAERKIPFINLLGAAGYLMEDAEARDLTTNGIHPNPYGYWALSRIIADQIVPGNPTWRLQIDAKSKQARGRGVTVSKVQDDGGGIRFSVGEESVPSLAPPVEDGVHAALADGRDTLVVEHLAPGNYSLIIDGEEIDTASHNAWAAGVAIDATPAHREAQAFREAVNDKNRQFTYSWKALNQVHIVGERRNSPSGQALPAEVIEFNKLADQRDAALRAGIRLKKREWRLIRQPR